MKRLSFNMRLWMLAAAFSIGFLVSGLFFVGTINHVKVNGPVYHGIAQNKELLADILPPPEYLLESYLVSSQIAGADRNTENAKVTDGMATQAAKQATDGGAAVKETVQAMKQIAGKIGLLT